MLEIVKIKKDVAWILEQIKCLFAKGTYATAWSADHTLLTGGPYLKSTIVWYQGSIYKAKYNNESELPTDTIYWECIGEGFLLEEKIPDWWALPGTKTFIKNKPTKTSDFLNDGEIAETPDPYASQQYVLERIQQMGGVSKTSELLNDGEDGTHPFITLENLPSFPDLSGFVPYIGATSNLNLGEFQLLAGQITFDQSPTQPAGVRVLRWNETDGTLDLGLKGGNVTLQLGQETVVRVVNKTATNLTEAGYQVVYISGAQGQRLKVDLALATSDLTSAGTIGLVTENISVNQEGFITSNGLVRGVNTTGSLQGEVWQDGDMLYLSPTIAGRVTNIKPEAPYHTVVIGVCVHAHANQGSIFVKVDNGYELEELHNVLITEAANNDLLVYEASTTLWKNKSLATVLGYTPAEATGTANYLSKFTSANTLGDSNISNSDNFTLINGTPNITGVNPVVLQIRGTQTSSNWTVDAKFATLQFNSTDTSGIGAITRGEISMHMTDAPGSYSDMVIGTSGVERLRIAGNGGNIGIGTGVAPTEKLTLRNNIVRLRLESATSPNSYYSLIENNYSATNPFNIFAKDHYIFGSRTLTSIQTTYLSAYRDINFLTGSASTGTVSDVRMVIKQLGNVLIGTTTDNGVDKLQVTGSILSTLNSSFSGVEIGKGSGTGVQNTVLGYQGLLNATTGLSNVALGYKSLTFLSGASSQNVSIGTNAGRFIADGTTSLTTLNNSVFLGFGTKASGDGETNQTVLGFNQTGLGSNSTIIGGSGNIKTAIVGRLMLGSTTDDTINQLQVTGSVKSTSSVQVGNSVVTASVTNVGAIRYRSDANNSYMDMVMQTGASTYAWVNLKTNTW